MDGGTVGTTGSRWSRVSERQNDGCHYSAGLEPELCLAINSWKLLTAGQGADHEPGSLGPRVNARPRSFIHVRRALNKLPLCDCYRDCVLVCWRRGGVSLTTLLLQCTKAICYLQIPVFQHPAPPCISPSYPP